MDSSTNNLNQNDTYSMGETGSFLLQHKAELLETRAKGSHARENLTLHKGENTCNRAAKIRKLREMHQSQLLKWRMHQTKGFEKFVQRCFSQKKIKVSKQLQELVAEMLTLQKFWHQWYACNHQIILQLQQNKKNNEEHICQVLKATVAELRQRFPDANLSNDEMLTNSMLDMITNHGQEVMPLISLLQRFGILPEEKYCPRHRRKMELRQRVSKSRNIAYWRCQTTFLSTRCSYSVTIYQGTIFEKSPVPLKEKLGIILHILEQHTFWEICNDFMISHTTVCAWRRICRNMFVQYCKQKIRIGGPGTLVKIDEYQIRKKKSKHKQQVNTNFVLRGIEQESKKMFVVLMPDYKECTLCSVIVQHVSPGGILVTSRHQKYSVLGSLGYIHKVVQCKRNIVAQQSEDAYTNLMQCNWQHLKRGLGKLSGKCSDLTLNGLIGEYLFHSECIRENVHPSLKFLAMLRVKS